MTIEALIDAYTASASDLRAKQVNLENFADELQAFTEAREALESHPEFSGELPETFFS